MSISSNPAVTADLMQRNQGNALPVSGNSTPRATSNPLVAAAVAEVQKTDIANNAKPDAEQTRKSLHEINQALSGLSVSVQFQIDPDLNDVIVKVIDKDSGEVIRQMPSEEVVRIAKAMDSLKGLLFAQSA